MAKQTTPRKTRTVNTQKKATAAKANTRTTKVQADAETKPAKAPVPHFHREHNVDTSGYGGVSDMINANRKTKIMIKPGGSREAGSMTERMQKSLYALRNAYGQRQFQARGFDNGVLSNLAAAGLITLDGGQTQNISGKDYLLDAETPVVAKITRAGMTYGKA